jgi:hypothetical protein
LSRPDLGISHPYINKQVRQKAPIILYKAEVLFDLIFKVLLLLKLRFTAIFIMDFFVKNFIIYKNKYLAMESKRYGKICQQWRERIKVGGIF